MTYHFKLNGSDRKNLVKAISEHIGVESKYLGAPSFTYHVESVVLLTKVHN